MCIKRKVSISCLGGRLGICLLLAFVPQLLFAQEDSVRFIRDSIQIQPESVSYTHLTLPTKLEV